MDQLTFVASEQKDVLLLVLPSLNLGGAERAFVTLANALADAGWRVSLVTGDGAGPLHDDIAPEVRVIDLGVRRVLHMILPLVRVLRAHPQAIVLSTMTHMNVITLLSRALAPSFKGRVMVQEVALFSSGRGHGSHLRRWIVERLMKVLYRFADQILVVSSLVRDELREKVPSVGSRISILPNPVDLARVTAMAEAPIPHDWLANPNKTQVFVSVARLSPEKGVDVLVRALATLVAWGADANLIIVGDGPERARLTALVHALDLTSRVAFVGFNANPWAFMTHADAVVVASHAEGFAMVLVEAMACGCQIVSTRCGSAPVAILDNGRFGELAEVDNPDDLARAMARSLENRRSASYMKTKAKIYDAPLITASYTALFRAMNAGAVQG
jgi:glycosyltransferase involved in cell wall biosynthesis